MNRRNFLKTLSILLGAVVVQPMGGIIPSQGIIEGAAPTPVTLTTEWVDVAIEQWEWVLVNGYTIYGIPPSSKAYTGTGYATLAEALNDLR